MKGGVLNRIKEKKVARKKRRSQRWCDLNPEKLRRFCPSAVPRSFQSRLCRKKRQVLSERFSFPNCLPSGANSKETERERAKDTDSGGRREGGV